MLLIDDAVSVTGFSIKDANNTGIQNTDSITISLFKGYTDFVCINATRNENSMCNF